MNFAKTMAEERRSMPVNKGAGAGSADIIRLKAANKRIAGFGRALRGCGIAEKNAWLQNILPDGGAADNLTNTCDNLAAWRQRTGEHTFADIDPDRFVQAMQRLGPTLTLASQPRFLPSRTLGGNTYAPDATTVLEKSSCLT